MTQKTTPSIIDQVVKSRRTKRVPRASKPRYPRALEKSFSKAITDIVKLVEVDTIAALNQQAKFDSLKMDSMDAVQTALHLKAAADLALGKKNVNQVVDQFARNLLIFNKRQNSKSFEKITPLNLLDFGDDVLEVVNNEMALTTSLITDVVEDIKKSVELNVLQGATRGLRGESLAKHVEKSLKGEKGVFKKAKTRAKLIARNQISSFNGALTKKRNENLGLKFYVWMTSGDTRVRDEGKKADAMKNHEVMHGKIYPWGDSPVTVVVDGVKYKFNPAPKSPTGGATYPGKEINCRCVARPMLMIELEKMLRGKPASYVKELQAA